MFCAPGSGTWTCFISRWAPGAPPFAGEAPEGWVSLVAELAAGLVGMAPSGLEGAEPLFDPPACEAVCAAACLQPADNASLCSLRHWMMRPPPDWTPAQSCWASAAQAERSVASAWALSANADCDTTTPLTTSNNPSVLI